MRGPGRDRRRGALFLLVAALVAAILLALGGAPGWGVAVAVAVPLLGAVTILSRDSFVDAIALPIDQPVTDLPPRLHRVLDALPDPAILVDRRGLVVALNPQAGLLLPTLRPDQPLSFALRTPDLLDAVERVLAGVVPRVAVEYVRRVPVDQSFEAHVVALAGADVPGREAAMIVLRDLTAVRRSEAMRVDFIANASHELRTPLASLLGFVETLQGPARDDAAARERFLVIMAEQARRMARIVDDLLSLSRIELNAHRRPEEILDLLPVIRHMMDALSGLARERGVTLALTSETTDPVEVAADRDEMLRVFENLIENAIRYGAAGRRVDIAVALRPERSEVAVSVTDHGPGIAPEHLPRLTERFYRVDVAESRDKGGTGLGLALVKHILARHSGRLQIASVLGQGATFTVLLPLAPGTILARTPPTS